MKNLFTFRKTKLCLLVLSVLAFILGLSTLNLSRTTFALETNAEYENLIPRGEIEQKALTAPIDCYLDSEVVAIIQSGGGSDQSLYIYSQADGFKTPILNSEFQNKSLKQVKRFSDSELIVSRNGLYHTVSIEDGSIQKTFSDGGTFFDLNQKYLVSSYGTTITIYEFDEQFNLQERYTFSATAETPVAINDKNEIFYTQGSAPNFVVKKHLIGSSALGTDDVILCTLDKNPTSIIANDEYCYVLEEIVYEINLADTSINELPVSDKDAKFDLGNLVAPASISFSGENLLISDSSMEISAVQEFAITEDSLEFTGFAIANGKTAYNRISKNAKAIEKFIDYTVVLDENKLTVINTGDDFTPYNRQSFYNFFAEDLGTQTQMPKFIALSENTILLGYDNSAKFLRLADSQEQCTVLDVVGFTSSAYIKDVCQQNGEFYILTTDGTNSWVHTINGNMVMIKDAYSNRVYNSIYVNVKNQVYLSDGDWIYCTDLYIPYCPSEINGYDIVDFSTDLAGRLFANDGNKIYRYDEDTDAFVETQSFTQTDIKDFALNYDSKEVSYITSNSEFVRTTKGLDNLAIDSLTIPTQYVTQDLNANQETAGEYKVYSVTQGTNLYLVNVKNQSFNFIKLGNNVGDYAFICDIDTGISGFILSALASPSGTILVDKSNLSFETKVAQTAPSRVYITTKVNAYYLPIVTPDSLYSIVVDLEQMQNIRIEAGTFVNPINKIVFLGQDYYFASYQLDNQTRYCYIPVGFTVEIPYVKSAYQTYSLEKVTATKVYADKELKQSMNVNLSEGQSIKLYKTENGVSLIAFKDQNGEWINGYISSASIVNQPALAVRNFVIIVAVIVCVFGSTLFLILRKKNSNDSQDE